MGRPANDLGLPADRFSHDLPLPEAALERAAAEPAFETEPTFETESASARLPETPAIEARTNAALTQEVPAQEVPAREVQAREVQAQDAATQDALSRRELAEPLASPQRAPEWPPAWLRVVQPEPEPEPEPEPVVAPASVEPAAEEALSPGEYAHAFGLTMAAALNHAAEAGGAGAESGERPPVQRPLITRAPRARLRPAKPAEADAAEAAPAADAVVDPVLSAPSPVAEPALAPAAAASVDVMDAPLFGSIGGTAARPPRPTRAARAPRPAPREAPEDRPDAAARAERATERTLPGTVYLLYLTGFLVLPAMLGATVAHQARRRAPAWLQGHYLYQIRTFWIGCAGVAVAAALAVSSLQATEFAGLALMMLLVLWMLLRAAAGYARLLKLQAHPNPRGWLI